MVRDFGPFAMTAKFRLTCLTCGKADQTDLEPASRTGWWDDGVVVICRRCRIRVDFFEDPFDSSDPSR